MRLTGRYLDGKTSTVQAAEVNLMEGGLLQVRATGRETLHSLSEVQISDRIGNTQRRIGLPDGAVCEIDDNDALDAWLIRSGSHATARTIFALERNWRFAFLSLVAITALSWAFVRYGIPELAEYAAYRLPSALDDSIGAQTMEWLDKGVFAPTKLSPNRQQAVLNQFAQIVTQLPDNTRYRLEFRQGGKQIGANALALPGGQIVVTDELIELAKDPNEVTAVLAHEVGHIVRRHALRMLLQSSATALVSVALLGDLSSISSLAASMPALLLQAKYSRQHETEADDFAYAWLREHGIATHYFSDILLRLEKEHSGSSALSYFSSHPQTEQRVRR